MRSFIKVPYLIILLFISSMGYIIACTHDNEIISVSSPKIQRGTAVLSLTDPKVSFDKSHSNVGWETAYLGGLSILSGRFDTLGFTSFNFDEANPANTNFEAWVWVNRVNTSEPGRDKHCLQDTYGVNVNMTTEPANIAKIKSTKVELNPIDKGYIVTFDFTFHGVTKSLTGKLDYDGMLVTGANGSAKNVYGFSFNFQFLAKTDYAIASTNIADNITVKCNAIFRQTM